ncbi:hypothetical protein BCV08_15225 [Vibrio breoganii]|uniref:tyrosine-type recombinase/integrase n=1 Tax=Vibrio breoganii TaxID=553239 RepID=UPI000C862B23|nr:tyrosine-type recombinase/integrase [Vibrio breoganii]PMF82674.1 hypothetical protein BCV08_15225 [Vibrio breoganii]
MPISPFKLTDLEIQNFSPKNGEQLIADGNCLFVRVRGNSKSFRYTYTHHLTKKKVHISLGAYRKLSLADARIKTKEFNELRKQRIDPKEHWLSQTIYKNNNALVNFELLTRSWLATIESSLSEKYYRNIERAFENHLFVYIGSIRLEDITQSIIIDALRPLERQGKHETLRKLYLNIKKVMDFGVISGIIKSHALIYSRDVFTKPKPQLFPALKPNEIAELLSTTSNADLHPKTHSLFLWQLESMTRPSEACSVKWSDIDMKKKVWVIPGTKMKNRKEHHVCITDTMFSILHEMHAFRGSSDYVFPSFSDPGGHMNSQTVNSMLKRVGFAGRTVSHGLRALASTTLNELDYDRDIIEIALAHVDKNEVRATYNRAEYKKQRRLLAEGWSQIIENGRKGINPVEETW